MQIDGGNGSDESLPLVYDPVTIANYWGKKPGAVATRIAQLVTVAGGFLSGIAMDIITKKVKEVWELSFNSLFLELPRVKFSEK